MLQKEAVSVTYLHALLRPLKYTQRLIIASSAIAHSRRQPLDRLNVVRVNVEAAGSHSVHQIKFTAKVRREALDEQRLFRSGLKKQTGTSRQG